ncbi:hypothetical protein KL86PLE_130039 [uncultured Pleomorphomonas sp.]|uniref:Uncharacterized protein n=1 Tax=uncultured Pleomorphomonas sp. TaxID=442121 RepID=A0A212L8T7_9HYPH|nr:hypothetical protein KL86PLE_130039 [uncultured Pleomorphomonas sp.]
MPDLLGRAQRLAGVRRLGGAVHLDRRGDHRRRRPHGVADRPGYSLNKFAEVAVLPRPLDADRSAT